MGHQVEKPQYRKEINARTRFSQKAVGGCQEGMSHNDYKKQGGKGNVDKVFFERIKVLLKIAIPSYKTKEALYLAVLTGLLVIRTYMSIWLADVNG